jgi:hypothetical protein
MTRLLVSAAAVLLLTTQPFAPHGLAPAALILIDDDDTSRRRPLRKRLPHRRQLLRLCPAIRRRFHFHLVRKTRARRWLSAPFRRSLRRELRFTVAERPADSAQLRASRSRVRRRPLGG